jgi:hypothetical protein
MFGGTIHTRNKNTEVLVVVSKEIGLDVNADKTKYMVMCRDQNAGQSHSIKTVKSSFEGWKHVGNNLNKSKLFSGRN